MKIKRKTSYINSSKSTKNVLVTYGGSAINLPKNLDY